MMLIRSGLLLFIVLQMAAPVFAACTGNCGPGGTHSYDTVTNTLYTDNVCGLGQEEAGVSCIGQAAYANCGICGGCASFSTDGVGTVSCNTGGCGACTPIPEPFNGRSSNVLGSSVFTLLLVGFVFRKAFYRSRPKL